MSMITGPGIYPGIPLDEYHGDLCPGHSVSHSSLERIWSHSLAAYWDRCYANPDRAEDEPSEYMILGRAAHHLFLGERNFQKHFVRQPARWAGYVWNANRTEHKQWLEDQWKKGLTVLSPKLMDKIVGMGRALSANPLVKAGILSGRVECSAVTQDPETGLWLKVRPDAIPSDNDYVDLKIVSDISEDGLQRAIGERGLHRQAALVCEVMAAVRELPLRFRPPGEGEGFSTSLVFVEASRPHCIEVVTLKVSDLERGMKENRMALRLLKRALDMNEWPGPSGAQRDARYMGITGWAEKNDDYRASQIQRQLAVMTKPQIARDQ